MRLRGGLSLVEALVAATLAAALLLALSALLAAARRADGVAEAASGGLRRSLLAGDLLRADLALAGYRGGDPATVDATDLGGPPLELRFRPGESDVVTVRFREERYLAAPGVRTVSYEAGRDRSGAASLYRREGSAARQPAVAGIASLEIVGWLAGGVRGAPPDLPAGRLDALVLALGGVGGDTRTLVIALPLPTPAAVAP